MGDVPDPYVRTQLQSEELHLLKQDLDQAKNTASECKTQWDKFRKERDFHRMHHRRGVQERRRLLTDFDRLKRHYEQYEPTLAELKHKYEVVMKEKMLMRLERDRLQGKADTLQEQLDQIQKQNETTMSTQNLDSVAAPSTKKIRKETPWPEVREPRDEQFDSCKAGDMKLVKSFLKCHGGPISRVAFHPKVPVLGTASDDNTWKLWSMPNGELVLHGEGRKNWVSGIDFHYKGNLVATTSGDSTVKIWDMVKESCRHTFTDHTAA